MKIAEIIKEARLPPDVIAAFVELGDEQRGSPELAMLAVQHAYRGGVLSPVVEHTGDLTHRMSHMAPHNMDGREYVLDKCVKVLRTLESKYGFRREMDDNYAANARYLKMDESVIRAETEAALKRYAAEHRKLKVYNRPQWLARQAAIAVGDQQFETAAKYLRMLLDIVRDPARFHTMAFSFTRDPQGNLRSF